MVLATRISAPNTSLAVIRPKPRPDSPTASEISVIMLKSELPHEAPNPVSKKATRVHYPARRRGVAAGGARAEAGWPNGQDATRGHPDARPRRAFSSHSRTFLPWATRTRLHRGTEPGYREARRGLETGPIPCAGG